MPRRVNEDLAVALSSALAEQNLSLTLQDCVQGRKIVRLISQKSGQCIEPEEDEYYGEEDDEEEEDEEEDDDENGPQNRVNTKFLSRMLTSLARTNKRVADASQASQLPAPPPLPLPPPRPKRSLAERRSRAELQIQRIAAACGLRVEIAIDDSFTEDEEVAASTAAQPSSTCDTSAAASGRKPAVAARILPAAASSRLLGAALQGAVAPKRPASSDSAAQASLISTAHPAAAQLAVRNTIKAGAKAPSGAKAEDADAAAEPVKRRRVSVPALYVPPSRRPKEGNLSVAQAGEGTSSSS